MYKKKHLFLVRLRMLATPGFGHAQPTRVFTIIAENSKQARLRAYSLVYCTKSITPKSHRLTATYVNVIEVLSIVRARHYVDLKKRNLFHFLSGTPEEIKKEKLGFIYYMRARFVDKNKTK